MTDVHCIPWTVDEILGATGGSLVSGSKTDCFTGVSIDSRRIGPEDVFVAIRGDVHDGHRFIPDVWRIGVHGLVVDRDAVEELDLSSRQGAAPVCVAVEDTTRALGDLASRHRKRAGALVVGITGSCGKTTTKEMTASLLAGRFNTLATRGNFNNLIGLPLTLLELNRDHEAAVVELGMNRAGEIRRLTQICRPDIGVLTNIGPVHLEGLGSIEGVMRAKGELLEEMGPESTAILNADDPLVRRLASGCTRKIVWFGSASDAQIRATGIRATQIGVSFVLELPGERVRVTLNTAGTFMVSNALAAAAVGHALGLSAPEIRNGLEAFRPTRQRMNMFITGNDIHVIDDTYNANPRSMEAAIHTLASLKETGRSLLVIGDMLELGRESAALHRELGALATRSGIERLYVTGQYAQDVAAGAVQAGMDADRILIGSHADMIDDMVPRLQPGDWILVKGSRSMGMEKVADGLRDRLGDVCRVPEKK